MLIAIVVLALYIPAVLMLFGALNMSATLERGMPQPVKVVETYCRLH